MWCYYQRMRQLERTQNALKQVVLKRTAAKL
jgi:hypothetical protein